MSRLTSQDHTLYWGDVVLVLVRGVPNSCRKKVHLPYFVNQRQKALHGEAIRKSACGRGGRELRGRHMSMGRIDKAQRGPGFLFIFHRFSFYQ